MSKCNELKKSDFILFPVSLFLTGFLILLCMTVFRALFSEDKTFTIYLNNHNEGVVEFFLFLFLFILAVLFPLFLGFRFFPDLKKSVTVLVFVVVIVSLIIVPLASKYFVINSSDDSVTQETVEPSDTVGKSVDSEMNGIRNAVAEVSSITGPSVKIEYQAFNKTVKQTTVKDGLAVHLESVIRYDPETGERIFTTGAGPRAVCVDKNNEAVYVSERLPATLSKFRTTDWTLIQQTDVSSETPSSSYYTGIAVSPAGDYLYACDLGNSQIDKYYLNFSYISSFAITGNPYAIEFDPADSGYLYIAVAYSGSNYITRYSTSGTLMDNASYASGFRSITIVDDGSRIFAITQYTDIVEYNSTLDEINVWDASDTLGNGLNVYPAIAIDEEAGYIYASSEVSDQVYRYSTDYLTASYSDLDAYGELFMDSGTNPGFVSEPSGLEINKGMFFVCEQITVPRVQIASLEKPVPAEIKYEPYLYADDSNEAYVRHSSNYDYLAITQEIDFTMYDVDNPSEVGVDFRWRTKDAGLWETAIDSTYLSVSLSGGARYGPSELVAELIYSYLTDDNYTATLRVFDTGLNSYVNDSISQSGCQLISDSIFYIDHVYVERSAYSSNIRSSYFTSDATSISLGFQVFEYREQVKLFINQNWNYTGINPTASVSWSGTELLVSDTVPAIYSITFVDNSSARYLAISDSTNDYLGNNGGFEGGTGHFVPHSSTTFDSIAVNSTIVSEGAFSGKIIDTDTATDYLYISQSETTYSDYTGGWSGYHYLSIDVYIEDITGGTSTLELEHREGGTSVFQTIFTQATATDRWFKVFLYFHSAKVSYDYLRFRHSGTATNVIFFLDNVRFWESSINAYTNSQGTNTLKPTLRNLDGYSNDVLAYNKINVTVGTRSDNTTLQSWNATTDINGQATLTYTSSLTAAEHFIRVYGYDNTFTGDGGSQKTYFTPITAGYVDYFESEEGNAKDFSEGTIEGFSGANTAVENGYLRKITSVGASFSEISVTINCAADTYDYFVIRVKTNSTNPYLKMRIVGSTFATDYSDYLTTAYQNIEIESTSGWTGTQTTFQIRIYNETGTNNGEFLFFDSIKIVQRDTPNLREYDSYFYLSSTNDTLNYKIYQDTYLYGIVSDTTVFQKNNTVGSHNLTYVAFQDLDDTSRVYLPSASYTYTFTVSTAFKIEDDFLEIGDWAAHYTIETNMDRDSVNVYLMLNGSYVQFPDSTYSTKPGSIVFSRPSYGYYNFTRIVEYDSTNYTRDTWITVTSNARMTTFTVSGTDSSSDYVVVSWNTNKGTGTLYAYDNNSLIATDTSEGGLVITKSSVVGLHNLSFDVVVESRNFSFVADYSVADWTASVTLSIYSSSSYYVSIDEIHTVTVAVTRSDDTSFDGYVFVNGTTVTVASGSGSFSVSSSDVSRYVYSVTHVQDLTATNRTFAANDLTVTFDRLAGYLSVVNVGVESAICVVTFNNSYDDEIVDNYEYAVYVNDQYYSTYTENTFTINDLTSGTYNVELRNIRNRDNEVDTGSSTEVSFEVTGSAKAKNDWLTVIILIILFLVVAIGAPAAGAWLYRRWKRSKSWLYGQDAIDKQNERLNF